MSALYEEISGDDHHALPLVLLHGWATNLRVFDSLTAQLATSRRVIRIDLPGHGRSAWSQSSAPFGVQLRQIADALPERCALLGWSLGGLFAMAMAAREPERVAKLVLVASSPRHEAAPDWPQGTPPEVVGRFADALAGDYERVVKDFLELQVRGSINAQQTLQQLRAALFAHGHTQPGALVAGLAILRRVDLRGQLAQIGAPTLVVAGQYDRITSPAATQFLAQQVPGAQLLTLRRAGHAPFLSHSEEFATAVAAFLA